MLSIKNLNERNRQRSVTDIAYTLTEAYGRRPTRCRYIRIIAMLDAMKSACKTGALTWGSLHGAQVALTAIRSGSL